MLGEMVQFFFLYFGCIGRYSLTRVVRLGSRKPREERLVLEEMEKAPLTIDFLTLEAHGGSTAHRRPNIRAGPGDREGSGRQPR
jgi:hypothetical protein